MFKSTPRWILRFGGCGFERPAKGIGFGFGCFSTREEDEMEDENNEYIPDVEDHEVDDDGAVKFGSAGIDRLSEDEENGAIRGEIAMSEMCFELPSNVNCLLDSNSSLDVDMLGSEFMSRCCNNMVPGIAGDQFMATTDFDGDDPTVPSSSPLSQALGG